MSFLDTDFNSKPKKLHRSKPVKKPTSKKLSIPFKSKSLAFGFLITLGSYLTVTFLTDLQAKSEDSTPKLSRLHYSVSLPSSPTTLPSGSVDLLEANSDAQNDWQLLTVSSGDTLASLFSSIGQSASSVHEVIHVSEITKSLSRIKPGETLSVLIDKNGTLTRLKYQPDITRTLVICRQEDQKLTSEWQHHPLEAFPVYRQGTIKSSLFEAAAENGISDRTIMEMAGIFGWDIDFVLDIREGDHFSLVYNELYKDGVKIRDGKILAAEFTNQGTSYRAVLYTDPNGESGYFSPDGKSMRKAFLRTPVEFSRISSGFTLNRWHPTLNKWRAHKGVDYAAPRGTPIKVAGDGKIIKKTNSKSYGKVVMVQHGERYTTVYAHMNSFAKGASVGKRVKQGQVIGFVGSTGFATGPHLHYEFRVNGVHRNPLTVKLPDAEPINPAYKKDFIDQSQPLLSMLRLMGSTQLAELGE